MSRYAALLVCITIDDSNKTIRFTEGSTTTDVTLATGDYFLRGDGASGDFCVALKTALESNADAAGNTYTVSVAMSADPTAATAVVTIARATGAGSFSILWSHANTTFPEDLLGFADEDTAHDGSDKVSTLSPAALWVSSDVPAASEPEYEYDVAVPMTSAGKLQGTRRGGPYDVRRLSFTYLDTVRVHDEANLADPDATFTRFHRRVGDGKRFEVHFATLSSGFTLSALSSSTRLGTAWHFDEDTAAELAPRRLEPGLPLYALDLRLLEAITPAVSGGDTWLERLEGGQGRNLRLYFTIQGVPDVFQTDVEDVPDVLEDSARPRRKLIKKGGVKVSPPRLNMATRRMEGGTVSLTLAEDDDGTLAELFSPRRRRAAYLTGNIDDNDTTINVTSSGAFDDTLVAYIDAETVTFPTTTGTSFTSAVRGAFDSPAQGHFGSSERGSGVFTQPPSWKGRRVYLHSYFINDDGTTTEDLARAEGVYEIELAPKFIGSGTWEIQCSDLSDGYWKKKIGSGLREIELTPEARLVIDQSSNQMLMTLGEGEAIEAFTKGVYQTQAIIKLANDEFSCRAVDDVDPVTDFVLTLSADERVSPPSSAIGGGATLLGLSGQVKTIRHVAILKDNAASIALIVLASRLGDYANDSFDQLPGMDATEEGGTAWRMGAGIEWAEIDNAAFQAAGNRGNGMWTYVIDDEITVGDFLFDFCLATGSVAYVTRAGLLSVMTLAQSSNASEMTIDNTVILGDEGDAVITYDEDSVCPRVRLRCNYDPLTKEYVGEINMSDTALQARYPNTDDTLELSSRAIVVSGKPIGRTKTSDGIQGVERGSIGPAALQGMLRRIQVAEGRARAYVDLRCHLDVMKLGLASLVELTVAVPDLEGASSFSSRLCRVISIGPDWNGGFATLTLQVLDKLYVIAPGVRIASAAGAALTLVSNGFEAASSPGLRFAEAGQPVQVWDVSAATKVSRTIVDITGNVITVSSDPGFAGGIENNVDFIKPDNASLAITAESASGFDGFDYTYQIRDDENNASVLFVTRWS